MDRETQRERDIETEREREIDREKERETERQRERKKEKKLIYSYSGREKVREKEYTYRGFL